MLPIELADLDQADFDGLIADAQNARPAAVVSLQDNDPLAVLHKHYLRKLRNPNHSDEHDLWQDLVRGQHSPQADPMQRWMLAAGEQQGLDDLLGQSHSIDSVMQGLDALGDNTLMAPVHHDSVLHLFAPEHLRTPEPQSLPELTLREHHRMAVDSAMPGFTSASSKP